MPLAYSNITGRKTSKLWNAQDVEFFLLDYRNQGGGVCRNI